MLSGDRIAFGSFLRGLSREDLRRRFGRPVDTHSPIVEQFLFGPDRSARRVIGAFSWEGELIGSANLCVAGGEIGEIALLVTEAARMRFVGRTLISALVIAAGQRGLKRLDALVASYNSAARALAARCGFHVAGHNAGYVRFVLDLQPASATPICDARIRLDAAPIASLAHAPANDIPDRS